MGSILSAISDDIDEYLSLCRQYNENVISNNGSPDCYGEHAKSLKKRYRDEIEASRVREVNSSPEVRMMIRLLGRLEDCRLALVIDADPELNKWWKKNRGEYDKENKRKKEVKKQKQIALKARSKLTPEERKVLRIR